MDDLYPPFEKAPEKVRDKALTFDMHVSCIEDGAKPCRKCHHLLRMAYHCHYGHLTCLGDVRKAIRLDLLEEHR